MLLTSCIEDVTHLESASDSGVRNQRAMTAPRHCLGAHDHRRLPAGSSQQRVECAQEAGRLHVIGVCSEAIVTPRGIVRILIWFSAPAEFGSVRVADSGRGERCCQLRPIEMRISPRCRKGAHIDKMGHAFPSQKREKILERSGRMSDREKPSGGHAPRSCPLLPSAFRTEA